MTTATDRYTEIDTALAAAGLELSVAEVQGTLVGAVANHLKSGISPQLLQLIEPQANAEQAQWAPLQTSLHAEHAHLSEQLFETPEDFELLLPDDDDPIAQRAEALAGWARGYMLGLLYNSAFSIDQLPENGAEIARDLMAIAELEEPEADGEEENRALFELQEYMKVGVQLIFESIYQERAAETPAQKH